MQGVRYICTRFSVRSCGDEVFGSCFQHSACDSQQAAVQCRKQCTAYKRMKSMKVPSNTTCWSNTSETEAQQTWAGSASLKARVLDCKLHVGVVERRGSGPGSKLTVLWCVSQFETLQSYTASRGRDSVATNSCTHRNLILL